MQQTPAIVETPLPDPAQRLNRRRKLIKGAIALAVLAGTALVGRQLFFGEPATPRPAKSSDEEARGNDSSKQRDAADELPDPRSLIWSNWKPPKRGSRGRTVNNNWRRQDDAPNDDAPRATEPAEPVVVRGRVVVPAGLDGGPVLLGPEASDDPRQPTAREAAQRLVQEARVALTRGRLDEARQKAFAAVEMNVTFDVFEDRPESILSEVARLTAQRQEQAALPPLPPEPVEMPEIALTAPRGEAAEQPAKIAPPTRAAEPPTRHAAGMPATRGGMQAAPRGIGAAPRTVAETAPRPVVEAPSRKVVAATPRKVADSTPSIQIEPAAPKNPLPDGGMRLSFDFHGAPWDFVLTQFAARIGIPLEMNLIPAGVLTYVDHQAYSPQETLDILNVMLIEKGFLLMYREGRLTLRPQPSAISSRADAPREPRRAATVVDPKAEQSAALLAEARQDLALGRIEEARLKAAMAREMNATYGLLDDRPEAVLEDLQRAGSRPAQGAETSAPPTVRPDLSEKRMAFNFRDAAWEYVLREYAREVGMPLVMEQAPPGTFTYFDSRSYSPGETLEVLNGFLSRMGYRMIREGDVLRVTRVQPMLRGLR